jgi:hypothetical protein
MLKGFAVAVVCIGILVTVDYQVYNGVYTDQGAADVAADRLLIRVLKLSRSAQHHTLRIDAVNGGIWPHARD